MRNIVLWAAAGLFLTGLWLGSLDVHTAEGGPCGTVFQTAGDDDDACEQPRSEARQLPIALLMLGVPLVLSQVPWGRAFRQHPSDPGV